MTELSSASLEALRKSGDAEKERIIRDVLAQLEKGAITGDYAVQKWIELSAVTHVHRRLMRQDKLQRSRSDET